jgi:hypothetical protein
MTRTAKPNGRGQARYACTPHAMSEHPGYYHQHSLAPTMRKSICKAALRASAEGVWGMTMVGLRISRREWGDDGRKEELIGNGATTGTRGFISPRVKPSLSGGDLPDGKFTSRKVPACGTRHEDESRRRTYQETSPRVSMIILPCRRQSLVPSTVYFAVTIPSTSL